MFAVSTAKALEGFLQEGMTVPRKSREAGWGRRALHQRVWHGQKRRGSREYDSALNGMSFECLLPLPSLTRLYCGEVCHFISDALGTEK